MDPEDARRRTTVGALRYAMEVLEEVPPAAPEVRRRGYASEDELLGGLEDPEAIVRRGCLELLEESRGEWSAAAEPAVVATLGDPEWAVRYTAVHALSRRPVAPEVLPAAITTMQDDENRYVRMLAVELVGSVAGDDGDAARALWAAREGDADPAVRRKAGRWAPGG